MTRIFLMAAVLLLLGPAAANAEPISLAFSAIAGIGGAGGFGSALIKFVLTTAIQMAPGRLQMRKRNHDAD
ncbi:hypothetical protein ACQKGC_08310 [Allorhizobium pseudoryzae]|uniref:hypothetical protein n=1 Tax=Allorhizobium pseudoryzae TaxID=379684 RepID=UPI003D051563